MHNLVLYICINNQVIWNILNSEKAILVKKITCYDAYNFVLLVIFIISF